MPAVRKPKPLKVQKQVTPSKSPAQAKTVISGQLKKKLGKAKPAPKERKERGVVFIKHLPHGFFEQQLRQYFKQFGHVTRLRLARSERTGGSKGYAFVEFEYPEVAKVAANTMDNYLMFQKVVKATYIPPEKQKFNYFKNTVKKVTNKAGKEIYVSDVTKATQRSVKQQNDWSEAACQKRTVAGIKKLKQMEKKYKHLGIDISNLILEPVKKIKETEQSKPSTSKKPKDEKKEPELADLLGNTITEDSDDEDYVDASDDDSEPELNSAEDESDDSEEEDLKVVKPKAAPKKMQNKNTGAERLVELTKRKPGTGGVQKKKKPVAAPKAAQKSATKTLQLAAAKQLAKPLQKKIGKKLKK
ncbi:PREDICTED: MKI67 FHA domain-interacting nucleolar phosphoprotein [Drosophila arizonae]|uniref:MKI67 FHA domain-interacting nucleolar phosphoprotein n=1 Tax=Drosophila arizonae TaxID=7263 RepID=A0ABM1PJL3_DROAR|nr:PREDICTED: MKI67 FHA domain-interacting nucleolar phosphoprotein [Drosophila arizonae]